MASFGLWSKQKFSCWKEQKIFIIISILNARPAKKAKPIIIYKVYSVYLGNGFSFLQIWMKNDEKFCFFTFKIFYILKFSTFRIDFQISGMNLSINFPMFSVRFHKLLSESFSFVLFGLCLCSCIYLLGVFSIVTCSSVSSL